MQVTKTKMAEILNISRTTFYEHKKQGIPVEKNGKCDVRKCLEWYFQHNTSVIKPGPAVGSETSDKTPDNTWRLEMQKLRLQEQTAITENAQFRAKIRNGSLVELPAAKRTLAFLLFPLQASINAVIAKFVPLVTRTRAEAVELQETISSSVRWQLFGKINTRDLQAEKEKLTAEARLVLEDSKSTESAKALAADIQAVYNLIDPEILHKLNIKVLSITENLAEQHRSLIDHTTIDSACVLARDHDLPGAPIVFMSRSNDRVVLNFPDEEATRQFLFAIIGYPGSTTFRPAVLMSATLTDVKFQSKIGDPKQPAKYEVSE